MKYWDFRNHKWRYREEVFDTCDMKPKYVTLVDFENDILEVVGNGIFDPTEKRNYKDIEVAETLKDVPRPILDACCGGKSFWYNKDNPYVTYQDNRIDAFTLCDGRLFKVCPMLKGDVTKMIYPDSTFKLVVFDPPHLLHAGENSWLAKKYGVLPKDWEPFIKKAFEECFRVLEDRGVLVFKWSSDQIPFGQVIKLSPYKPLFGDRKSKTRWTVFMKMEGMKK